ncbi:MAG: hypothetical protein C7B45_03445 [Sulfobacillus acidophilus]|uniref:Uncharacterized protein n=1 Tax=Sulfobacillus acidophilus TaxID=53633 RepID=A0A2T2WMB7_9FIRM|nr:MAG: hypothetical protein C7B45_03445 [Sulfobacillus acidophilus]
MAAIHDLIVQISGAGWRRRRQTVPVPIPVPETTAWISVDRHVAVLAGDEGNLRHAMDDRSLFQRDATTFATGTVPIPGF